MTRSIVLIRYSFNILLGAIVFLLVMITEQGRIISEAFTMVAIIAYFLHKGLRIRWKISWPVSTGICICTAWSLSWT